MTIPERVAQAAKEIERECRGGYCDGHFRGWSWIMYYTRTPGIAEMMEQLVGEVQQAKRDKQRLDLKWWDKKYHPAHVAINKTYKVGYALVTTPADRKIYDQFVNTDGTWK